MTLLRVCSWRCSWAGELLSGADSGPASVVGVTLPPDTAKGNRPSFADAAPPEEAEQLYERFCAELRTLGVPVQTGVFGTKMEVELVNEGPVTIVIDV
jgi:D-tyrosyl-tRNA(Tyr) deacylase